MLIIGNTTFQVNLNSDGIASSLELNTYLVESGRVCIGAFDNFHIFYFLVNGASGNWRKSLQFENYSFSVSGDREYRLLCLERAYLIQFFHLISVCPNKLNRMLKL